MSELNTTTLPEEQRLYAAELMQSRKGLNTYTNGGDRKYFFGKPDNIPGAKKQKGYSDCSSAVRKVMEAVLGIDIGTNTSAQVSNRKTRGKVVHETDGIYPDINILLPGDALYFKGNKSHVLDVGHVEMYIGNGKICGHGSGTGPKIRDLMSYCKSRGTPEKRYFMTIRWIPDDGGNTDAVMSLFEGMYDNARVQKLQLDLIALGYDLGKYGADGDFGKDTKRAVEEFQKTAGLEVTGTADEETLKRIEETLDLINDGDTDDDNDAGDNTPEPEPDATDANAANTVTVAPGTYFLRYGPGKEYDHDGQFVMEGAVLEVVDVTNAGGWVPVKVVRDGKVQLRWLGPNAII